MRAGLMALLAVVAGCASPSSPDGSTDRLAATSTVVATAGENATTGTSPPTTRDVAVESITDGDTLRVTGGVRVRLIGIDTPEVSGGIECFGQEATVHLGGLIPPGTAVRLEFDVERADRYGRTLAYVHRVADGLFVNLAMAADGYAAQLTVPPNVAHADEFGRAVAEARAANLGLWSACAGPDTPSTTLPPTTESGSGQSAACDPAYPDACIPPPPPDLDCSDVAYRRFRVLAPDPHGFDADNDGIGCES